MKKILPGMLLTLALTAARAWAAPIPTVDLSGDTARQVVIAQGTPELYQGHPTTLLLPDGKTIYVVWTLGHGGTCGPMKRSDDGGRTWSELLPVPENWTKVRNCPSLYRLADPRGATRLFVFAGQGPDGDMSQSYSDDEGKTWTPMTGNGLKCIMPFCTIAPVNGGKKLVGLTNIRRPGETKDKTSNIIAQSESTDGGLSWSGWQIVLDLGDIKPCEPQLVRSPDGRQLLCLLRENSRKIGGLFMTSDDEGRSWSEAQPLPPALHGDRHMAQYAPDGRLVICFRDTGKESPTRDHFVAWVGSYEDILAGRNGRYRIKLLHSYAGGDCGYPGLEVLPDGTFVATTYIKYREGPEKQSVVSTRFTLAETDGMAGTATSPGSPAKMSGSDSASSGRELEALRERLAAGVAVSPLAKVAATGRPTAISSEPVQLAHDVPAAEVDGRDYDLIVVGGTASGIACAVRAAREGCSVLLVQHNRHIGGMMINGLMQWDALYGGPRATLFTELLRNIEKDAIERFGEDSRDHQILRCTHEHYPISWAESFVAEREFNRLVAGEKKITLLLSHYPSAVERDGALLRQVTLREYGGSKEIRARAAVFADATYEGDLCALAGVPYRVGREARDEYGEPHAGKIFCNIDKGPAPREAVEGRLNIRPYSSQQGSIDPTSPFTADGAVQAYNYRFCLTRDPANRLMLTEPPPGYNRDEYLNYERKSLATNNGPNQKSHMNSPILPGENHAYPEADWPTREKITERHKNFGLGLIWFLQNDPSISETKRQEYRQWGLPKDEFPDHGHIPYEMYVREARRIVARHVMTELEGSLAPGLGRTPIMPDSIAITDWYMDSHSCTTDSRPGFHYDGKLILTEQSRPSQIPYRALLPQGVDNLLVPVCLGATHVAWGSVRLEPVWMQTGEAAGFAAALAIKAKTPPAQLDPESLVRTLVERRQLVSFFNDLKVDGPEPWIPAAQYFGTKGFFDDYNVRPGDALKASTGKVWADGWARLQRGQFDPDALARAVAEAERNGDKGMTTADFAALLPSATGTTRAGTVVTRGAALVMMFALLPAHHARSLP